MKNRNLIIYNFDLLSMEDQEELQDLITSITTNWDVQDGKN